LLFVSPIAALQRPDPHRQEFARAEKLDIVFVGDDDASEQQAMIARLEMGGLLSSMAPSLAAPSMSTGCRMRC